MPLLPLLLLLLSFVTRPAFCVGDLDPLPDDSPVENIDTEKTIEEREPLPVLPPVKPIQRRKPAALPARAPEDEEPDADSRKELAPDTPLEKAQKREESQDLKDQEDARTRRRKYTSTIDFAVDFTYSYYKLDFYDYATNVLSDTKGHFIAGSFEWLPIVNYGKAGIGGVFGTYIVADKALSNSLGAAGLNIFSLGAYLTYRFDYFYHQIVVPYGRVGTTFHLVSQASKDGSLPRSGTQNTKTFDAAFGLAINLYWLDPQGANQMDSDYSVNETYFFLEYASVTGTESGLQPNVDHKTFRGGLRLEF